MWALDVTEFVQLIDENVGLENGKKNLVVRARFVGYLQLICLICVCCACLLTAARSPRYQLTSVTVIRARACAL